MYDFLEDLTLENVFHLLIVMTVIVLLMLIAVFIIRKMSLAEDKKQPLRKDIATVFEKPKVDSGIFAEISEMWVWFELSNGDHIRLIAKANNSLMAGDIGELTWQGKRVVGFKRQNGVSFFKKT